MKRSFDDMMENFNNISVTEKRVKTAKELKDPFKIGKSVKQKETFTRDEVIDIINKREKTLIDMFNIFMQKEVKQNIIPTWVF